LVVNSVARQSHLQAVDVLLRAQTVEGSAGGIEFVRGDGGFDSVERPYGDAVALQAKIPHRHHRVMGIGAPTVGGTISRDQRPRDESPAAGAIDFVETRSQRQLAFIRHPDVFDWRALRLNRKRAAKCSNAKQGDSWIPPGHDVASPLLDCGVA
jgi:hypothetical protein